MTLAVVLAHGGGAPELLTFALPVSILVGFLALERRARRRERAALVADDDRPADVDSDDADDNDDDDGGPSPDGHRPPAGPTSVDP